MIGNTFSQMANADKLSPQQLQVAIKDGTIPSYIGIPLLQEKMKQSQEAQALSAGQQKPLPIAQQVMQQAQQQHGVEALPSGLPVEGMAGGGIIAFADGGLSDDSADEYEDYLDEARKQEEDDLMDEYAKAFQGGIGSLPAAKKEEAKEGVGDFIARIMHKESRGKRYDKNGNLLTSEKGALGEMQVMPGTSRDPGFGVKPAQSNHPDELARVGRDYANTLLQRYGDPKLAAIAYNMGPGATDKWLASGADQSKLPQETQGYVKGFSGKDGESQVKDKGISYSPYGFGNTASQDDMTPEALAEAKRLRDMGLFDSMKETFGPIVSPVWNALTTPPSPEIKKQTVVPQGIADIPRGRLTMANDPRLISSQQPSPQMSPSSYDQSSNSDDQSFGPISTPATQPAPATAAAAPTNSMSSIEDIMAQRYANLDKQREQDKYMALLQAGLGMMGGTSPNALANIAAGGQQGIQSLAQANAARTSEENALLSGRLGLAKIGSEKERNAALIQARKDIQDQALAQRTAAQGNALTEKKEAAAARDEAKNTKLLSDIEDKVRAGVAKDIAGNVVLQNKPDIEAIKEKMVQDRLRAHKTYGRKYKDVYGENPFDDLSDGTIGSGAHPKQIQSILDKYK